MHRIILHRRTYPLTSAQSAYADNYDFYPPSFPPYPGYYPRPGLLPYGPFPSEPYPGKEGQEIPPIIPPYNPIDPAKNPMPWPYPPFPGPYPTMDPEKMKEEFERYEKEYALKDHKSSKEDRHHSKDRKEKRSHSHNSHSSKGSSSPKDVAGPIRDYKGKERTYGPY